MDPKAVTNTQLLRLIQIIKKDLTKLRDELQALRDDFDTFRESYELDRLYDVPSSDDESTDDEDVTNSLPEEEVKK